MSRHTPAFRYPSMLYRPPAPRRLFGVDGLVLLWSAAAVLVALAGLWFAP